MAPNPPPPAPEEEGRWGEEIGAFLLDLDGTLIDSEPYHKSAEVVAFGKLGLTITPADLMPCTGLTLEAMLDYVHERFGLRVSVTRFLEIQTPEFTQIIEQDVELFEDARQFLQNYQGLSAIVTSSLPWYVEVVTRKHPILLSATRAVVCAADVTNGKPHPEPFLLGAAKLGRSPSECVAVEDSRNGVRSAKAAGCYVVGMDREGHGHLSEADRVVASFDDLSVGNL